MAKEDSRLLILSNVKGMPVIIETWYVKGPRECGRNVKWTAPETGGARKGCCEDRLRRGF